MGVYDFHSVNRKCLVTLENVDRLTPEDYDLRPNPLSFSVDGVPVKVAEW
jgi:hypothetical protein